MALPVTNRRRVYRPLTHMRFTKLTLTLTLAFAGLFLTSSTRGGSITIDITTRGAAGLGNGAWYIQTDPQPTGTGVIQPFVRIQNKVTESGYNTDYRPVEFDTKDENQWTHALKISDVPVVSHVDGNGVTTQYRQFLLDINEGGNTTLQQLSLNEVEVYLGPTNLEHNYPNLGTKIYTLDTGGHDRTVELSYRLNSGSGSGDMFLLVPNSLFTGPNQWVYLYSNFGVPNGSDAGFEEWAVLKANNPPPPPPGEGVPLPAVAYCGFALLGGLGLRRRQV